MEFEPHAFSAKYHNHSSYSVAELLFGEQIKSLQIVILIYPNQAENVVLTLFWLLTV
jgi:hypothetical protein